MWLHLNLLSCYLFSICPTCFFVVVVSFFLFFFLLSWIEYILEVYFLCLLIGYNSGSVILAVALWFIVYLFSLLWSIFKWYYTISQMFLELRNSVLPFLPSWPLCYCFHTFYFCLCYKQHTIYFFCLNNYL